MKARVVAQMDLGDTAIRGVEFVGERFLVATCDTVWAVTDGRLDPQVDALEVIAIRGDVVLTADRLFRIGGPSIPLSSRASAFAAVAGGAIVTTDEGGAAVSRFDWRGQLVWRTPTPPPKTVGHLVEMDHGAAGSANPRHWEPEQWNTRMDDVCVSGDRVLVVFSEMPRSGIGIGYGLDMASGELAYLTPAAPYGKIAPAPNGAVYLGLQGYRAFETWLVDRHGNVVIRWPSHGIVLPGRDVRVIELENVLPSRSCVATLNPDGTVARGAALPAYYTSPVVVAEDGSAIFWRDGALVRVSSDGTRLERLFATPPDDRAFSRGLAGCAPGRLVFAWSTNFALADTFSTRNVVMIFDVER